MTARWLNMTAMMMAAVLGTQLAAQSANQRASQSANQGATTNEPAAAQQQTPATATRRVLVVSLEDHKLALGENGKVKKIYTVAVGKPSTPSPVGTRWMGLSIPGYGIHGTNVTGSIGKAASHGCIRMARKDLEELYPMVEVGDTVELIALAGLSRFSRRG